MEDTVADALQAAGGVGLFFSFTEVSYSHFFIA